MCLFIRKYPYHIIVNSSNGVAGFVDDVFVCGYSFYWAGLGGLP